MDHVLSLSYLDLAAIALIAILVAQGRTLVGTARERVADFIASRAASQARSTRPSTAGQDSASLMRRAAASEATFSSSSQATPSGAEHLPSRYSRAFLAVAALLLLSGLVAWFAISRTQWANRRA